MKADYTAKELREYQLSLFAMRALDWLTLAGAVWLGAPLILRYAPMPPLLSTIALTLAHALARVWGYLGWSFLVLCCLLAIVVACFYYIMYPSFGAYFNSCRKTVGFRRWLHSGQEKLDRDGNSKEQDSVALDGFIAFLADDFVLVVVLVPQGIKGKDAVDSAAGAIKEYADECLPGLKSGGVRSPAGARYWIYRTEVM